MIRKIVVTGALGHLGSALIRALPKEHPGAQIVMIDNLSTSRYSSLFDLPLEGFYSFIEEDVTRADLKKIFKGADWVIHLAALAASEDSAHNPELAEKNNLEGTRKVAQACLESGARLFFTSTTSVYSKQTGEVSELAGGGDLIPQTLYAATKLKAENVICELAHSGLRYTIGRLGTIFGVSPGMRFHTAVNRFCWQAATHQPLSVWQTAWKQVRPYLDLRDFIRVVFWFFRHDDQSENQLFNLVSDHASVSDIAAQIESVLKRRMEFLYLDSPMMNDYDYRVSCKKILQSGFVFKGDLKSGIAETLDILNHIQDFSSVHPDHKLAGI